MYKFMSRILLVDKFMSRILLLKKFMRRFLPLTKFATMAGCWLTQKPIHFSKMQNVVRIAMILYISIISSVLRFSSNPPTE
jgi:hypothetical protein